MSKKTFIPCRIPEFSTLFGLNTVEAYLLDYFSFRQAFYRYQYNEGKDFVKLNGFFIKGGRETIANDIAVSVNAQRSALRILISKGLMTATKKWMGLVYCVNQEKISIQPPKTNAKPATQPEPKPEGFSVEMADLIFPVKGKADLEIFVPTMVDKYQFDLDSVQAVLDTVVHSQQQRDIGNPAGYANVVAQTIVNGTFNNIPAETILKQRQSKANRAKHDAWLKADEQRRSDKSMAFHLAHIESLKNKKPAEPQSPQPEPNVIPDNAKAKIQALTEQWSALKGTGNIVRMKKMGLESAIRNLGGNL